MKRIIFRKSFQKAIFERLLQQYSRSELSAILHTTSSSIYHMKNGRIDSIEIRKVRKITRLLKLHENDIQKNTIKIISDKDILSGLDTGRRIRSTQLKNWKKQMPEIKKVIFNNELDVEKWFESYQNMINFGPRKINEIKKENNEIILKYTTHSRKEKKEFVTALPRKIPIDAEFQYFFGLWCGDKAGGGRIGVVNKSPEINMFTDYYLKKLYQKTVFQMLLSSNMKYTPTAYTAPDQVVIVKNMAGSYVMAVFSVNGILKSFFKFLLDNLDEFIHLLPQKNLFFAGLFDAEGNVSLEDRYFRWACMNAKEVELYKKHLKNLGLFKRYDGASLVTDNREMFLREIYPHMKEKNKINRIKLLFFDGGSLENRFKKILSGIRDSPGKTASELNIIFGKKKMWPKLKFLCDTGYVRRDGYPMKFYITEKGMKEVVV